MIDSNRAGSKNSEPLITIITVCRNSARTIRQSIESVLNQDYNNIEYIVIDGQSNDGTLEILEEYKRSHPSKFYYISERDSGLYFAMNKGIEMANGELIGIINSDDFYRNQAVSTVVNAWLKNGYPDLVLGSTAIMDDKCSITMGTAKSVIEIDKSHVTIPHPSSFISKNAYFQYGKFDVNYRYAADRDLLLRFIFFGAHYIIIETELACFRQGGLGACIGVTAQIENFKIDNRYISTFDAYKNFLVNYLYSLYKKFHRSLRSKWNIRKK